VLVGLLLPAVQQAREAARRSSCVNNLKQIGLGLHNYYDALKALPPGGTFTDTNHMNWSVFILPFIEEDSLHTRFDLSTVYNGATNRSVALTIPATYHCPSSLERTSSATTGEEYGGTKIPTLHYYGNMGPKGSGLVAYDTHATGGHGGESRHGTFKSTQKIRFTDVTDGLSKTLMAGEISFDAATTGYRAWTRGCNTSSASACAGCKNIANPINATPFNGADNFNDMSFGSNHPGGCQFVFADGSVHFIQESVEMDVYKALASRNGGESVGGF
jgi:prepilin-type processing-associated H-X9-DG protein